MCSTQYIDNNNNNTNNDWRSSHSHQRTGGHENKRTGGDHPNYCINEIGQNTEKSPGDLRRLAVTQTPVKDHQLTLIGKTLNNDINNNKGQI